MVVLRNDWFPFRSDILPGTVARPEVSGGRKLIKAKLAFYGAACYGAVMFHEGVTVRTVDERDIKSFGIGQCLLHPGAYRIVIVLGLNQGDGDIGFIIEDIVCPFFLAAGMEFTSDNYPARCE
jgi:hypothetical protein